ncbi:hypothetical protein BDZ45DRAFT_810060 [Acephala macrosclerotiorum]|nr:hypothetical protein BDZ45DRAFT_810060 [Acephala macrosclerotiorum]
MDFPREEPDRKLTVRYILSFLHPPSFSPFPSIPFTILNLSSTSHHDLLIPLLPLFIPSPLCKPSHPETIHQQSNINMGGQKSQSRFHSAITGSLTATIRISQADHLARVFEQDSEVGEEPTSESLKILEAWGAFDEIKAQAVISNNYIVRSYEMVTSHQLKIHSPHDG